MCVCVCGPHINTVSFSFIQSMMTTAMTFEMTVCVLMSSSPLRSIIFFLKNPGDFFSCLHLKSSLATINITITRHFFSFFYSAHQSNRIKSNQSNCWLISILILIIVEIQKTKVKTFDRKKKKKFFISILGFNYHQHHHHHQNKQTMIIIIKI